MPERYIDTLIADISDRELLEVFLSSAPASLALFDKELRYIGASRRWLEDYRIQDIIGKSHYEVFPSTPDHWKKIHQRALAGETVSCSEEYFQHNSERGLWLKWEVRPWHSSSGEIGGMIMLTEDITARKEAELELRKNQDLLLRTGSMAKVGGWEVNMKTMMPTWTDEVFHIHEVEPGTVITLEQAIGFYPAPYDQHVREAVQKAISEKAPFTFELPLITANGNKKWVRAYGEAEEIGGEVVRVFGTFQDITVHKQHEEELTRARLKAEELSQVKSQLMANVCHEIRTPLNGVLGLTQLALDTKLTKEQRGYLQDALACAKTLMTLLDDIINFSRVEVGSLNIHYEAASMTRLFDRVLSLTKPKASEKDIELKHSISDDLPEVLLIDEVRVGQILINLISNAIKFSPHGSSVRIRVTKKEGEDVLRCAVEDDGIGIAKDHQEKIFESFSQADTSVTREYGGFGLGLAIVKRLTELMSGKIHLESEEGQGSTFTLELPYEKVSSEQKLNSTTMFIPQSAANFFSNAYILLVEDNIVNQKLTRKLLEKIGCKVEVVENGQLACERLCIENPSEAIDAVLMDCQMPVMSGIEATQRIRTFEQERGRHTPIIAITANAMAEDKERCLSAGMDYYLAKPIDKNTLYSMIAECTLEEQENQH